MNNEQKQIYSEPQMTVIHFESSDIITTSTSGDRKDPETPLY